MHEVKQNFICIGAQKAGTTTLADILSRHPDIYIPAIKETKYFLFDEDYSKGIEFYNSYFKSYSNQLAAGEVDPDYLLFPFTAKRIRETLGDKLKILVILRNPADRAYSHYLMTKRKGLEPYDFEKALQEEKNRCSSIKEKKIFAYLDRGYYGRQLHAFLDEFPRENFLFLLFEDDLIANREESFKEIQQFLGVPVRDLDLTLHSNEAGEAKNEFVRDVVRRPNLFKKIVRALFPSKRLRKSIRKNLIEKNTQKAEMPKLTAEQRSRIISNYFLDDIHLTEKLTGRSLKNWYN